MRSRLVPAMMVVGWALSACSPRQPIVPGTEISIYAAISLREPLERLAPRCEKDLDARLVFNFGASGNLARQIQMAGKADLFFSADEDWIDRLARAGLVDEGSRCSLLSNRLVLVVPVAAREDQLRVESPADLRGPAIRRLSLADPETAPAGKYARRWLERAGLWSALSDRVVPAVDARAALAAVESGAVEAGVVYRTDARLSSKVRTVYEVPEAEAGRISYVLAVLRRRPDLEAARRAAAWLAGPEAARTFEAAGFIVTGAQR